MRRRLMAALAGGVLALALAVSGSTVDTGPTGSGTVVSDGYDDDGGQHDMTWQSS